ncbi:MAG: uridine kinase [Candidatus Sericytochromatia bacterium]|nr:uridine kinase [Candidatus Sericytochromatia bacterium]
MQPPGRKPLTIGVSGGSGSGKTTVARNILELAGPGNVAHLCHDAYYHDHAHLTPEERAAVNYDHPDALDNALFVEHLRVLQRMQAAETPVYDYARHARLPEPMIVQPRRVILVEGILILAIPEIRRHLDIKVFVDTDADLRFIRRLRRDITERGRSPQSVIDQYLATVRPMQEQFVEPSRRFANVVVPEGGMNEVAVDILHTKIQSVLRKVTGPLQPPPGLVVAPGA